MDDSAAAPPQPDAAVGFVAHGGELGRLIAAFDWSTTSLGPIADWPAAIKTAVGIMIRSPVPLVSLWGDDGVMIYNDAYSVFAGGRHPALLGMPVRAAWPEVADFNDHVMKVVMAGGTLAFRDQELTLHRRGAPEPVWMNLDYSPVPGPDGGVLGVIAIVVETTARVLADRRSAAERDRLAQLFEQAPTFMAMLSGPDHRIDLANPGYMRLVGDRPILGRTVAEALPDAVAQGFLAILDDVYRSGKPYRAERARYAVQATPGGASDERYVDFVYQPITGADGHVTGIFVEGADVTDRVHADAALSASEARFAAITDSIDQMIWSTRPDGFHDYYNRRWYEFTGVPEGSTDGAEWNGMFHPDDQDRAWTVWRHSLATGEPYRIEYRLRHASGSYRWVLGRAQAVRNEAGAITRWFGTCTDIDDVVAARETLARSRAALADEVARRTADLEASEARLRTVFATTHLFQGLLDPAGTVLDANAASLAGIEADLTDVIGMPFWESPWCAATPGVPELVRASVVQAARGESVSMPLTVDLPTGRRSFDFTLRPVRDTRGAVVALVPEAAETTARLQAEEALRQSQKLDAMGQLTGGVAHDFNNLLTPIIGSLDMLERRGLPSERERRLVGAALQSAERAKTLVQRLLAFARRQPLQSVAVDIGGLVAGMAELVRTTTGPMIDVVIDTADALPAAIADPNQLEMAILNLSVNARDAMPAGGTLAITAKVEQVAVGSRTNLPPGDYIRVAVTDTGVGMDRTTLTRAIEPFYSTKGVGKGTGLGLSMVHGLASQLGGALTIDSEPGHGTTVELWLPQSAVAAAQPATLADSPIPRIVGTALVVDDEDLVRMSTADMLSQLGFAVLEAASAEEALRVIDDGLHIDVLITDHLMPGMTGVDLARAVRERRPNTPALIVSGFADAAGIAADLPRLTKPFRQADLAGSVLKVMSAKLSA